MTPEQILSNPARTLSDRQRRDYFDNGALLAERLVDAVTLARLNTAVAELIEASRRVSRSDTVFDLEPGHSTDTPRLRRVSSPCDQNEVFWQVLRDGPLGDLAVDLLGPDVRFYQAKLNFKWAQGGTEVKWHQDQPFFPHTNHAVLTMGVYLNDCGPEQGPLEILPGSHRGEIYNHYDDSGNWRGAIGERKAGQLPVDNRHSLTGVAGSVTVHNYRTVHGSLPNRSDLGRPLLLYVLSAADALPYTAQPLPSRYEGAIVRGRAAQFVHHEPGSFRLPPDWSGGYGSIFASQQEKATAM